MKLLFTLVLFTGLAANCFCQNNLPLAKHVFIITTDGFRWQEVFNGADSAILRNTKYVKDTGLMVQQYWHPDAGERRKKLLPFFWSVIAKQGQLSGNRNFNNNVDVANRYKISYPGYNEMLTGYADNIFIPNLAIQTRNSTVLEYLAGTPAFNGKVAAFCSWSVLPYSLHKNKNSSIYINGGYRPIDDTIEVTNQLINAVQANIQDKGHTRHDLLTFEAAKNYIEQQHPSVVFLGLGETDEFAHHGQYDRYLQKANQVDAIIAELWYYVQTDPYYKNNTTFIITTDHGRGDKANNWKTHGFWIRNSGQVWTAMIGPGIAAVGEVKQPHQVYLKQLAATIAKLLGVDFVANHSIARSIELNENATPAGPANTIALSPGHQQNIQK